MEAKGSPRMVELLNGINVSCSQPVGAQDGHPEEGCGVGREHTGEEKGKGMGKGKGEKE